MKMTLLAAAFAAIALVSPASAQMDWEQQQLLMAQQQFNNQMLLQQQQVQQDMQARQQMQFNWGARWRLAAIRIATEILKGPRPGFKTGALSCAASKAKMKAAT